MFFTLLIEHRLALTLYPLLKPYLQAESVFASKLKNYIQTALQKNILQQKWIISITQDFTAQAIRHVFLKGPVLNQQLYGQEIRRTSQDIDILVHPEDLTKAHQRFLALGLVPNPITPTLAQYEALPKAKQAFVKDFIYTDPATKTHIELHIKTCLSAISASWRIGPLAQVQLQNKLIPVLPPEDNFLYLAIHAAKHEWQRLQWLTDLAVFYKVIPIDWQKLCALAQKEGRTRILLATKDLLKECFDLSLPEVSASWLDKLCVAIHLKFIHKHWLAFSSNQSRTLLRKCYYHAGLVLFHCATWAQKRTYLKAALFNRVRG